MRGDRGFTPLNEQAEKGVFRPINGEERLKGTSCVSCVF
jgi:hypothetical protein